MFICDFVHKSVFFLRSFARSHLTFNLPLPFTALGVCDSASVCVRDPVFCVRDLVSCVGDLVSCVRDLESWLVILCLCRIECLCTTSTWLRTAIPISTLNI